ncbi:hypothetical protein [Haloprofundus halophilus]|uniref:hypothetical protein n=1 Tax=Haloprofundus halophilus TaxID=2283527 RepID=UPI001E3A725C|nr:hypothetical protein [Haloprofundus halophilus]
MLIDRYLPEYDVTAVRHTVVNADPETTYEAMLAADLMDLGPTVRALGQLRDVPRLLLERNGAAPEQPPPKQLRFADVPETAEWTLLDEAPGEEFVFGAVGKFWRPEIEWLQVDAEEFAEFDEPGNAKLAISLSVRPYGERRTLLSYEARTVTTSERARRNFRLYWRVIGPFAGYLMSQALERIEADAEAQPRREPTTDLHVDSSVEGRSKWTDRRTLAAFVLGLVGAYHFAIRPWHRQWGATNGEARATMPGDDLLSDATAQVTHAIEIDAPTEAVWPWLVQIGQGRGGFYSYDWIENAIGADIHNVDRIVPEYQELEEGDVIRLAPKDYPVSSPESAPEVVHLDPERALVLSPPGESPAWTWAFVLVPLGEGTTRLLARMRSNPRRSSLGPLAGHPTLLGAVDYLFWEPAHFLMERKMLTGIKRRAERAVRTDSPSTA